VRDVAPCTVGSRSEVAAYGPMVACHAQDECSTVAGSVPACVVGEGCLRCDTAIEETSVTTTAPFLSDAWMAQVSAIKARHENSPIDTAGFVVNATITGVPFGDNTLELHSEHGPVIGWMPGHASDATLSFALDYPLARELVIDPTLDTLEQAIRSDQLMIVGDTAQLRRWWSTRINNPDAVAVALDAEVRAVTS
jgi:hypothetical protein